MAFYENPETLMGTLIWHDCSMLYLWDISCRTVDAMVLNMMFFFIGADYRYIKKTS